MSIPRCLVVLALTMFVAAGGQAPAQPIQPKNAKQPAAEPLPDGALWRLGTMRLRHLGEVRDLCFTSDGKHLASVGDDHFFSLWDIKTGLEARRFQLSDKSLRKDLRHSRDDLELLMALRRESMARLYDASATLSADEKSLVLSSSGKVRILDLITGRETAKLEFKDGKPSLTATSRDGKLLARFIHSDERETELGLVETATGKVRHKLRLAPQEVVQQLRFSDDARYLAGSSSNQISIWDLAAGKRIRRYEMNEAVTDLAFFPGSGKLVSAGRQGIHFWDLASDDEIDKLPIEDLSSCAIAFSPDGKLLASTGKENAIILWDVAKREPKHVLDGLPSHATAFTFSTDGTRLACATNDGTIHLWNLVSLQQTTPTEHRARATPLSYFAPDKLLVRAGPDGGLQRLEASTGKVLKFLSEPKNEQNGILIIASDGRRSALSDRETGVVSLWDNEKNVASHKLEGHATPVALMSFSPDGAYLATLGSDKALKVWNVGTGKQIHNLESSIRVENDRDIAWRLHTIRRGSERSSTPQLVFSPDNRFLAALAPSGSVSLVEMASGKERAHLPLGAAPIAKLLLSPDGRLMATIASGEDTVRVWDTLHGKLLHGFVSPDGDVQSVAFSPSSKLLAVGSADGVVTVYDLVQGKKKRRFTGHRAAVNAVFFAPDGGALLSAGDDGLMIFWNVDAPQPPPQVAAALTESRLQELWDKLGHANPTEAYRALDELTAHPEAAVKLLRKKLQPAAAIAPDRVKQLVADLGNSTYDVREKASQELIRLDMQAIPALDAALREEIPVEAKRRIEKILDALEAQKSAPEHLRSVRAIEVLERVGGTEALRLCESLASGAPHARLTIAAKKSLRRTP
jgi:WD40 repeat protein